MITDVFNLKKKSWHMSMMTYIWGYKYYDFSNMCPYFWLSLVNLFLIVPVALFKAFITPIVLFLVKQVKALNSWYDARCEAEESLWLDKMRAKIAAMPVEQLDKEILDYHYDFTYHYKKIPKRYVKLFRYQSNFGDIYNKLDEFAGKRRAEFWEKQEQEEEKPVTNSATIGKLTVQIQYFAKGVGIIIALVALYWLFVLGKFIVKWLAQVNWSVLLENLVEGILIAIGIIIIAVVVCLSVYTIGRTLKFLWCRYGSYCIPCANKRKSLGNAIIAVLTFIVQPFVWFARGIKQLWLLAVALKQNNCPAINWKD